MLVLTGIVLLYMEILNLLTNLWERICVLHVGNSPWMCIGDFNELAYHDEKVGTRLHCQNKINLFREFLNNVGLMDMSQKGCKFTWAINPRNGVVTKEKIDRMLVNWKWRQEFPNAMVTTYPPISSNHSLLVLDFKPRVGDGGIFKYEAFWEYHQGCSRIIEEGLNIEVHDKDPWLDFNKRLSVCKRNMSDWHKKTSKNAQKEISKLKK